MARNSLFTVASALARRPRLVVSLVVLVLLATQGAVAESGDLVASPAEYGDADLGPDSGGSS
ncbi:hypothetical protein [Halobaculum sp. MBLA0143]|uniref:hypothetical protein n=1 Tax=Halobaculum sp. MBLA0143 TaxID=3079933 RepID=UPI00352485E5